MSYVNFELGNVALMHFCTSSMSTIMELTKHGAIIPTHTPCLVIANMVDMEEVQKCISAGNVS